MRSSKVMRLIRKAIPYMVVAVVVYLIYTAHTTERFGDGGGGGNNPCTQGKVATCAAPYYLKDGNRCVKDVSGSRVPVWGPNPTCECSPGKTVKCPSSKPKLRSSDNKCFATTAYTGSSVEQSCN